MKSEIGNSLLSDEYRQGTYHENHQEKHIKGGQYLKSLVYGGLDGAVNTLAVILGGIASGAEPSSILAFGISVMIGDGLGMGLGDYLSAKAAKDFIQSQTKRQEWEFQNKKSAQKQEVKQIYCEKGYSQQDSNNLVQLIATNSKVFVNVMMLQELGLVETDTKPLYNGLITFISFALFGFIPLLPYVIGAGIKKDNQSHYLIICIIIAAVLLFILGFAKAALAQLNRVKAGIQTLILGAFAVGAGYGVGFLFRT